MFEHVRNWLPWNERERRKKEFVKKLQHPHHGKLKVRFKNISKVPIGAIIMLSNSRTHHITTAVLLSANSWAVYGTNVNENYTVKTSVDLEDFFTDIRVLATDENELVFNDPGQYLDVNYNGQ